MRRKRAALYAVVTGLAALVLMPAGIARADGGDVDTGWGSRGVATIGNGDLADFEIQPDGKIVAAGTPQRGMGLEIVRLLPNGTLDPTFGTGGRAAIEPPDTGEETHTEIEDVQAVAVAPDGGILIGGVSYNNRGWDFALVRYTPNGAVDRAFGDDGFVQTGFGLETNDYLSALAVAGDGSIVAAGTTTRCEGVYAPARSPDVPGSCGAEFALARYLPDGTLDESFNRDGTVTTNFASGPDGADEVIIGRDKTILAAGYKTGDLDLTSFALVRYFADGSRDRTFGDDGRAVGPLGRMQSIVADKDGYVAAGSVSTEDGKGANGQVVRFDDRGKIDTSFGSGGRILREMEHGMGSGLVRQPDGRLVVAASGNEKGVRGSPAFTLLRYEADGRPDRTFGAEGTAVGPNGVVEGLALQKDGKLVAGGSLGSSGSGFRFVRFFGKDPVPSVARKAAVRAEGGGSVAPAPAQPDRIIVGAHPQSKAERELMTRRLTTEQTADSANAYFTTFMFGFFVAAAAATTFVVRRSRAVRRILAETAAPPI